MPRQAGVTFHLPWRASQPSPAKPISLIAQVEGSRIELSGMGLLPIPGLISIEYSDDSAKIGEIQKTCINVA
jgi:hypothetical protein